MNFLLLSHSKFVRCYGRCLDLEKLHTWNLSNGCVIAVKDPDALSMMYSLVI